MQNAFATGASGSEKVAITTLGQAIVEHFWSGHEPIGNVVDMVTIGFGVSICGTWLQVVFAMATAEDALVNLHRPTGDVAYDDTDHDVWSEYHHDVTHAEHLIAAVINRMVIRRNIMNFFCVPLSSCEFVARCRCADGYATAGVLHGHTYDISDVQNMGWYSSYARCFSNNFESVVSALFLWNYPSVFTHAFCRSCHAGLWTTNGTISHFRKRVCDYADCDDHGIGKHLRVSA